MQEAGQCGERVYGYVSAYLAEHGYAPSVREIARACELGKSTVLYRLKQLETAGWIRRDRRVARSLQVVQRVGQAEVENAGQAPTPTRRGPGGTRGGAAAVKQEDKVFERQRSNR